jgi:hypothetical protein
MAADLANIVLHLSPSDADRAGTIQRARLALSELRDRRRRGCARRRKATLDLGPARRTASFVALMRSGAAPVSVSVPSERSVPVLA